MGTMRGVVAALLLLGCGASAPQQAGAEAQQARGETQRASAEARSGSAAGVAVCEAPWASGAAELASDDMSRFEREGHYLGRQAERYPEVAELFGRLVEAGPVERGRLIREWAHDQGVARCRYADSSDFLDAPYAHIAHAVLLRIEGNDIFQWMERLGSVGDATLAARVEELFDGETSALLVIDDGASFGALREALRVARARERGLPLYLRGALAIEDVEGTVDVAPRLEDLTLARLGTRRPGEPIPLSFTATRQGIVVSAGALVQGEECSIYDLPPDSATPSPAIRPPSDGSAEEALWVCLGGLAQTAGEVRSIWIGGEADVPANHVIWLGSFLSHQDVFPNATVYLSLADPFWLEGQ